MDRRYERRLRRYTAAFFWIGLVGLVAIFVVFLFLHAAPSGRMTVLIASDPVVIWSWDSSSHNATIITIPAETALDAIHGYGQYALSSLWKLGEMDTRERAILAQTVSEMLAVPVPWYIGFSTRELKVSDPDTALSILFAPTGVGSYLSGAFRTNLTLATYLQFARAARSMSEGKTKRLDIARSNVLRESQLPDGSKVPTVDSDRLDLLLNDNFEEAGVRAEALHIAVLNATHVPGLADRFARFLTRMGASVVLVGNSDQSVTEPCLVIGSQSRIAGNTAGAIRKSFGCKTSLSDQGDGRADLTVLVGEGYASVFRPKTQFP